MTDRAAELERLKANQRVKRCRMRKAGLLPPLPECPQCGATIVSDRWLPLCSICARVEYGRTLKANPLRVAADAILRQLRAEARAGI